MSTYQFFAVPPGGVSQGSRPLIIDTNDEAIELAQAMADRGHLGVEVWKNGALIGRFHARSATLVKRASPSYIDS